MMVFLKEMKMEVTQNMQDECKKLLKATAPKKGGSIKLASTSATADQPWLLANKHIKYEYHPRDEDEDDDSDEDAEREPIELGEGGFGKVFQGTYLGRRVAIKEVKFDDKTHNDFEAEVQIVIALHHPNIVECYGAAMKAKKGRMVLQLLQVSLGDILHSPQDTNVVRFFASRGGTKITTADKEEMAVGIARGMMYLHMQRKRVVHNDLKPSNVLLDHNGVPKICDFGMSKMKSSSRSSSSMKIKPGGTLPYNAPELLTHPFVGTHKLDVWAYGILLWELFTEQKPFDGMQPRAIEHAIKEGDLPPLSLLSATTQGMCLLFGIRYVHVHEKTHGKDCVCVCVHT